MYRARTEKDVDLADVEDYRNRSKEWRNQVSYRLVGRVSTSSQKFQDNLFEDNAIPPSILVGLGKLNKEGKIERWIYSRMEEKLKDVSIALKYVQKTDPFVLKDFLSIFKEKPGLKRSIDKAYEIIAYSLFSTIISSLQVQMEISIKNKNPALRKDFADFIQRVLRLDNEQLILPAKVFRAGVTNAADRGLDMWANFGPAIQVKHIDLSEELADDVTGSIASDEVVLICLDAEKDIIARVLAKTYSGQRIRAIITVSDLERWYGMCLGVHRNTLGKMLLKYLEKEFKAEFPSNNCMTAFMRERGYV